MTTSYLSVTVDVLEQASERVQDFLHEAGALGLEVRDSETRLMPNVRGPRPGETIVIGFFEDAAAARAAQAGIQEHFPEARSALEEVVQQDWSSSWKALIRSVTVGRLWVGPPWEVAKASADRTQVVIEPKMAFGTGDHPTTSLCLAAVDDFVSRHPGCSVLDVGTGTGVLAIAARKLGAGRVVGVDNDEVAVELARENAGANGTGDVELSGQHLESIPGTFDLVLANILANTLIELAPLLAPKVGQRLVLAGILVPQREEVTAAYVREGLVPAGERTDGEWLRLDLARP